MVIEGEGAEISLKSMPPPVASDQVIQVWFLLRDYL